MDCALATFNTLYYVEREEDFADDDHDGE